MDDEFLNGLPGEIPKGPPTLRVVDSPRYGGDALSNLDLPTSNSDLAFEDGLLSNQDISKHISDGLTDNGPPEYVLEPVPAQLDEAPAIAAMEIEPLKKEVVETAERLASYNIAKIAFEFQDGKHGYLVDPQLVSKVRLDAQLNKFQRLMRFLKEGPKIKKELSKEEILSGLVKNASPLTKAPISFSMIEGVHFSPKDGSIGLTGVTLYPANNGGVFEPSKEQSEGMKALLKSMEESMESLRLTSETYAAAERSSSGFMSAIYLLGKADDVKRSYQKYAATAQRMAEQRAEFVAAGIDTRALDSVIDEKNLMTPALIKNKTSSWKNFAKSFVQYGSLVSKIIEVAQLPSDQKPTLYSKLAFQVESEVEIEVPTQDQATNDNANALADKAGDIKALSRGLEEIKFMGMTYFANKNSSFAETAKTTVGIEPPPGHKFAHPEIPLLWALFRNAYPDRFGDANGTLSPNDPRSKIGEKIERDIPYFLYIDDRMPDIVDPIERIESYINTLNFTIPAESFSPLSPVKSVLNSPKISQLLKDAGVVSSGMSTMSKYTSESAKLGLQETCPYVFDVNSHFHNINLSRYQPPAGKKLVHPLLPLLVEYHKNNINMLIKESGVKKPSKEFLKSIGAIDGAGQPINFDAMLYIDADKGGSGSAYEVYAEFLNKAGVMSSEAAGASMPKEYDHDYCLGLPEEIRFKLGVVKNLEADYFDTPSRSAGEMKAIIGEIESSPRSDVYNLAFASQVLGNRGSVQAKNPNQKFAESKPQAKVAP